jgi:hypothetical protein
MKKFIIGLCLVLQSLVLSATTIEQVEKICAVCGTKSTQTIIVSSNQTGSPDLDLRPPEMLRSTIMYWVQECPACGYCYHDISERALHAENTVKDPAYIAQRTSKDYPELADQFLCVMMINDAAGLLKPAIYASICAGWACDDQKAGSAARAARKITIDRMLALKKTDAGYFEQAGGDEILLADLLRRTAEFDRARDYASQGLSKSPEDAVEKVLKLELALIEKKDTGAHTVDEAFQ